MKADKLATCFETSQKLKEAGFPQEDSYFVWIIGGFKSPISKNRKEAKSITPESRKISAFTVSELLEELPLLLEKKAFTYFLTIEKSGKCNFDLYGYVVDYIDSEKGKLFGDVENESLPEALAQLWLRVKEYK